MLDAYGKFVPAAYPPYTQSNMGLVPGAHTIEDLEREATRNSVDGPGHAMRVGRSRVASVASVTRRASPPLFTLWLVRRVPRHPSQAEASHRGDG